jgi:coproporphyrinogen III oxidase
MSTSVKEQFVTMIHELQDHLCSVLEREDGDGIFITDTWERSGGGGGITRVMSNGTVFEKAGINTSVVYGTVTDAMRKQLNISGEQWFACGISSVIHPANPWVPTVHFNYRYFELHDAAGTLIDYWFGGGADLTPYYLVEEDIINFHTVYKQQCDLFDTSFYPSFKQSCDTYFINKHRNHEARGVGGIFYDYKRPTNSMSANNWIALASACGYGFVAAYMPIVQKRKQQAFTAQQKHWQEIRRGRYVEFNLVHDRGTLFGLHTNGRTESILMSLPPTVRFEYHDKPTANSPEAQLLAVLQQPKNWVKL